MSGPPENIRERFILSYTTTKGKAPDAATIDEATSTLTGGMLNYGELDFLPLSDTEISAAFLPARDKYLKLLGHNQADKRLRELTQISEVLSKGLGLYSQKTLPGLRSPESSLETVPR